MYFVELLIHLCNYLGSFVNVCSIFLIERYHCTFTPTAKFSTLQCDSCLENKFSRKAQIKIQVFQSYLNADSIWLRACNFDSKHFDFQDLMQNIKHTPVHEQEKE